MRALALPRKGSPPVPSMIMAVAGLASRDGVEIDDTRPIATSFPAFEALLDGLAE